MKKIFILYFLYFFFINIVYSFSQTNNEIIPTQTPQKKVITSLSPSLAEKINFLYKESLKQDFLTWQEILQIIIPTIAIFIGGIWTYYKFIRQRHKYPRIGINFAHSLIKFQKNKILLHICIKIINKGNVLIKLNNFLFYISCFNPIKYKNNLKPIIIDKDDDNWSLLDKHERIKDKYEIEPEEDHEFHLEIVLNDNIKYLKLYCHIENAYKKKNIGWDKEEIYEIQSIINTTKRRTRTAQKIAK